MDDPLIRVSDADREQAVLSLREHLLAGRLTLEEFTERVDGALRASVSGELAQIQRDLPPVVPAGGSSRRPTRFTATLFGHVVRRGRLRLRGWSAAAVAFGDLDFDLRQAAIDRPRTTATVVLLFGNADIYVPEGVNVEVSGLALFGHLRERGHDSGARDGPTIRVRAACCCATVDVWRVPADVHGSYGEIVRRVRDRERELPA